ncbi:MAG: hypothetical protein ACI9EW_000354 [Cellvibrionaceae bacterium]|jgi:hypothetical protein
MNNWRHNGLLLPVIEILFKTKTGRLCIAARYMLLAKLSAVESFFKIEISRHFFSFLFLLPTLKISFLVVSILLFPIRRINRKCKKY